MVPTRTQVAVMGNIEIPDLNSGGNEQWMTEAMERRPGLYVGRTLLAPRLPTVPLVVCNVSDRPMMIRPYEVLAELEQATTVDRPATVKKEDDDAADMIMRGVDAGVDPNSRRELKGLIDEYTDIFSKNEFDLGETPLAEHSIETGAAAPLRQTLRPHPLEMLPKIDQHVRDLVTAGIAEPCSSPWAANLVVVKKKDGSLRFCVDYRRLNLVTRKDAYPLPRIDACLDALSGSVWFSAFDLRSGYHQVPMSAADADKTSFLTRSGTFRFRRVPFGLCNAGSTFQRVMDLALRGLTYEMCLVYLDDIIVFSKTVREHLERLRRLFERLRDAKLKLKPSKCHLLQTKIAFLGHVVSGEGVSTDPEKIQAVKEWPVPGSVSDTRSFLGLASYYRRFVSNYATIAAPLHGLAQKNALFIWTDKCNEAFETLKDKLMTSPVLALPR